MQKKKKKRAMVKDKKPALKAKVLEIYVSPYHSMPSPRCDFYYYRRVVGGMAGEILGRGWQTNPGNVNFG